MQVLGKRNQTGPRAEVAIKLITSLDNQISIDVKQFQTHWYHNLPILSGVALYFLLIGSDSKSSLLGSIVGDVGEIGSSSGIVVDIIGDCDGSDNADGAGCGNNYRMHGIKLLSI